MALKIISVADEDDLHEFLTEISIMRKLNHRNIVRLVGAWKKNSELFVWSHDRRIDICSLVLRSQWSCAKAVRLQICILVPNNVLFFLILGSTECF